MNRRPAVTNNLDFKDLEGMKGRMHDFFGFFGWWKKNIKGRTWLEI